MQTKELLCGVKDLIDEELFNIEEEIEDAEQEQLDQNSYGAGYDCGFRDALKKIKDFIDEELGTADKETFMTNDEKIDLYSNYLKITSRLNELQFYINENNKNESLRKLNGLKDLTDEFINQLKDKNNANISIHK